MIKIAVCDDDLSVLDNMSGLLDRYRTEQKCELVYTVYHSPLELMAAFERGQRWDILLLDILMPGETGMELAREIRTCDEKVKIIFLTSSAEFAVDSYTVGATFYQLKPTTAERFFPVLAQAIDSCIQAQHENLILKCKTGIATIAPDKLEYCEVTGRSLILHLSDGRTMESSGTLDELETKLLPTGLFLRVRRSYLVNMAYIQSISSRAVTLRCMAEIPIPQGKHNEIKTSYLNYAFEKEAMPGWNS